MRTTVIVIATAILLGVVVGLGSAFSALKINAWNPELEFKKHADLMREAAEEAANPNAKAFIESTVYDFGIRDVKEKGQKTFEIKNVGSAPLTLEVNRTTCTCTGIDLSSKRLLPGQTAIATVHYDAERAMTGPYNQGGTIVTNDPENREIFLSITGIFTSPIVLNPSSAVFPTVPASETRSAKIRIYGFEKTPLQLEDAQWSDRDHFDLKLTPSELNDADKENSLHKLASSVYDAEIVVKPGLPVGTFQEKFTLRTNYAGEPRIEFLARGQVAGSGITIAGTGYLRDKGYALLGKTTVGQRLTKDVSIQFSGVAAMQADLKIKETVPSWLKVSLTQPRDIGSETSRRRFYTVTIEIPTDAPVCNFMKSETESDAMITLETGLSDTPTLKIPIQFAVER